MVPFWWKWDGKEVQWKSDFGGSRQVPSEAGGLYELTPQSGNLIVTSSAIDKKLKIEKKNLENKLEIYKNLEIKLEICKKSRN